jgi:predicted nucleic acid-binding protein
MTLVDTSVWIDHFRTGNTDMAALLTVGSVMTHPFIIGELACGDLRSRAAILGDIRALPCARMASHEEVHAMIERRKLWGKGIGWIDAHLLAAATLSNLTVWTADKAMSRVARALGVAFQP